MLSSFFVLAGAWLHQKEWQNYNEFYTTVDNKKITVTGTVIDVNETIVNHKNTIAITLTADTIATKNVILKSNKLFVFYIKSNKLLEVGDMTTFYNVTCKKPSSEDFQRYQIKEQILATVFDDNVAYRIDNHP